jgi:3-isopropylmalate dehydratase small subunit
VNHGFRVLIAPSFADILFTNAYKNGLLPIVALSEIVQRKSTHPWVFGRSDAKRIQTA